MKTSCQIRAPHTVCQHFRKLLCNKKKLFIYLSATIYFLKEEILKNVLIWPNQSKAVIVHQWISYNIAAIQNVKK